jgi:hypothetical protein
MECAVCGNKTFSEHSSGFLVCTVCGVRTERRAASVFVIDNPTTPPLKRKIQYVTEKVKKQKNKLLEISFEDYIKAFQQALIILTREMVEKCGVKKEAIGIIKSLWFQYLDKVQTSGSIKPKNSIL